MDPDSDIAIRIAAPAWRRAVADAAGTARRAAVAALHAADAETGPGGPGGPGGEISVLLADDAALRRLNSAYRGIDKPTNVLAFAGGAAAGTDAGGPAAPLGDVAVALETLLREAAAAGTTPADHLSHLVVHGVLHLLGHDHDSDAAAAAMERLETRVLARLGVADPYGEPPIAGTER